MARRQRRRNPTVNEINWTPIVLVGAVGLAAYMLYNKYKKCSNYKPPSCGGTPGGNFLCWLSGGAIQKAACAYVCATSCGPMQPTSTCLNRRWCGAAGGYVPVGSC
jgi:hypothetical protein